jgi:hypothetical protein
MKASCAETNGAMMLFEDRVVRGKTTPLHMHRSEDELVYVLEGELLVHADGEEHRVGKGGLFFAPRGVAHALLVTSETAHLLCLQTPGSGEAFYRAVSDPSTSMADAARPPDLTRLREGAQRSESIELLGPPPSHAEGAHSCCNVPSPGCHSSVNATSNAASSNAMPIASRAANETTRRGRGGDAMTAMTAVGIATQIHDNPATPSVIAGTTVPS